MSSAVRGLMGGLSIIAFALWGGLALGQGSTIGFSSNKENRDKPIEITADSLVVDQEDGTAIYEGDVLVSQGTFRIAAPFVRVAYERVGDQIGPDIETIFANGGVTMTNGAEAAEAGEATFLPKQQELTMLSDVIVTQGNSAIAGQKLDVDLESGRGVMTGRVTTILRPKDDDG